MPIVALALACSVITQAEGIGTGTGMKTDIISESEYLKLEQAKPHFKLLVKGASLAMPVLALDSVAGFPGDTVDYYLTPENTVSVSSFNILFNYDASLLAVVQVDNSTGRSASFEYFSYQLDENGIQGNIRLIGVADLNQDNPHLPLPAGSGQIARLKFSISRILDFAAFNIPFKFKFLDSLTRDDNSLTDPSGAKIQQEEIAYQDGVIAIRNFPDNKRGDINLNGPAFEISDAIYFVSNSQTHFSYNSDSEIGGILMELKSDLVDTGKIEFDVYGGMKEQHFRDGNLLRVLIYSLDGNHLPAGSENFMTVKNLADFEISGLRMASGEGQLMEVSYSAVSAVIPESYYLSANYPNPFNPERRIGFHLPRTARVELSVYNLLGQWVNTLVEGVLSPGEYFVSWDGKDYQKIASPAGFTFTGLTANWVHLNGKWCL